MLQHAHMSSPPSAILETRLKMAPVRDPAVRGLMNLFVASASAMERFERITATKGLSYAGFNVLRILRGNPDGHHRGAIGERLVTKNADVTRLVDGLVRRGYVRRVRRTHDARLSVARITRKGLEALAALDPAINGFVDDFRQRLSAADWAELSRLLEAVYGPEAT